MNEKEQEYLESYARPEGCLAVAAAFILMAMIGSIALNITAPGEDFTNTGLR